MNNISSADPSTGEKQPDPFREAVLKAVETLGPQVEEISLKIHSNPELCFEEKIACSTICEFLSRQGFEVEKDIAGLKTAFRAQAKGDETGPSVAFLAEYDALKGIGHGCGHNLIAGAGILAGAAVKMALNPIPGNLLVIGTPAEEGGGGKITLADAGVFDGLSAAMMAHPSTQTSIFKRSLGCMEVDVTFKGKPAHAAAEPWKGRNALDALILSFNAINAFRQHIRPDARIHGIITKGGEAVNVIPETASGKFLVRALNMDYVMELHEKVKKCFEGAALQTGCELDVAINEKFMYRPFQPNYALGNVFRDKIVGMGMEVKPDDEDKEDKNLGSSDIGNVSSKVPCIHPEFFIGEKNAAFHSREFTKASITPKAHEAMKKVAAALALTAIDIFTKPDVLENIKKEHENKEAS